MQEDKIKATNEVFAGYVQQSLKKLTSCTKIKDMKLFASLVKLRNRYSVALKDFEDCRNALAEEYGRRNDEGQLIRTDSGVDIDPKRADEFYTSFRNLIAQEVEIDFHRIDVPIKALPGMSGERPTKGKEDKGADEMLLSPDDIANLESLINFIFED